jgi:hypothetical protein
MDAEGGAAGAEAGAVEVPERADSLDVGAIQHDWELAEHAQQAQHVQHGLPLGPGYEHYGYGEEGQYGYDGAAGQYSSEGQYGYGEAGQYGYEAGQYGYAGEGADAAEGGFMQVGTPVGFLPVAVPVAVPVGVPQIWLLQPCLWAVPGPRVCI